MNINIIISRFNAWIYLAAGLPLVWLLGKALLGQLGANPVDLVTDYLGIWSLIFLLLTLAITPARQITHLSRLAELRRPLGLSAFSYAGLHVLAYAGLDFWFDWNALWIDVLDHSHLQVGLTGFMLMVPLALTSNQWSISRLRQNWKRLHRLSYLIAICGVLHYVMLVKKDIAEPLAYAAGFFLLLSWRVWRYASAKMR